MKHDTGNQRARLLGAFLMASATMIVPGLLRAQSAPTGVGEPPTLTVAGVGESSSRPDRAVLQLGAVAQAENASAAQEQVNAAMQAAIEAIRGVGIDEKKISTVGISLHPVYADRPVRPLNQQPPPEPRIVGYRAGNQVRVVIDDLAKVGDVIDAGVKAGVNQVAGLSFELKDDAAMQRAALAAAAEQARAKADALAAALGLRIEGVLAVSESGVNVVRPRMEFARASAAALDIGTPVQPGNVDVHASVTVTYRISPERGKNE